MLKRLFPSLAIAVALIVLSAPLASAGLRDDLPSCYAAEHIRPAAGTSYSNLVYVLVDQTVAWNPQLERQIIDSANNLMRPGTKFVVAEFSAFSQGRYLQVLHTGIYEKKMPASQRNNTPITKLSSFAGCMRKQAQYAAELLDGSIVEAVKGSSASLDQSDIFTALRTVSAAIRQSRARHKVLIVASDGLENSAITSFYGAGTVRIINPAAEIQKAEKADAMSNFGGARAYFIGGALMPPATHGSLAARNGYRNPLVLRALSTFWHEYFAKSDADLVEFGEPSLVMPTSYGSSSK